MANHTPTLAQFGQFLTGMTVFLTVAIPAVRWLLLKPLRKAQRELQEATIYLEKKRNPMSYFHENP